MKLKRTVLTPHFKRKYTEMTDCNWHSELVYHVAKDFGLVELAKQAKEIMDIHDEKGYLSDELYQKREDIRTEMMKILKENLPEKEYRNLNGCF